MRSWSIKTRLAIIISLLFVIFLAAIVEVTLAKLREEFRNTIGAELHTLVSTHAADLDNRFELSRNLMQNLSEFLPAEVFENVESAQKFLDSQHAARLTFDLGLFLAKPAFDGTIVAASLADSVRALQMRGTPTAVKETNRKARESRQPVFSPPYASPSCSGCPAVVLVHPLFAKDGRFLGYLAGAMRLDGQNFLAAIRHVKIGREGYFYLSTRDRIMIMHPDPERLLKLTVAPGVNTMFDQAVDGFEGAGFTTNSLGVPVIIAIHRLKTTGWILAANYPAAEAEAPFKVAQRNVYILAAMAAFVMLLFVWLLTKYMLRPLSALTRHVAHAHLQSDRSIHLGAAGEIGTLEQAFNGMVGELAMREEAQKRVDDEIRHINANLESLVKARTADLEVTNHELSMAMSRLVSAQRELVEAEKLAALGSLVAGMAHELNTPIGNCVLAASTMEEGGVALQTAIATGQMRRSTLESFAEQVVSAAQILDRNLQRATYLLGSFKELTSDRELDLRQVFCVSALLEDALSSIRQQLAPIECVTEWGDCAELTLDSYPVSLAQVVIALINNVLLHAFPNEQRGTLTISLRRTDAELVLSVGDNGVGITPENLKRVFDPFFTTRLGQGSSGLGLHIVYNIVTGLLGGRITVESVLGEGCSFNLALPLHPPSS